mgnify:CR=1 FL=1
MKGYRKFGIGLSMTVGVVILIHVFLHACPIIDQITINPNPAPIGDDVTIAGEINWHGFTKIQLKWTVKDPDGKKVYKTTGNIDEATITISSDDLDKPGEYTVDLKVKGRKGNETNETTATATFDVVEVTSVTFNGALEDHGNVQAGKQKVWKGDTVTWQVKTTPDGHYDLVSLSDGSIGTYNAETGVITYDCPTVSASKTFEYKGVTVECGSSAASAIEGPIVYHLLSVTPTPDKICQDEDSRLVYELSPNDEDGPVPEFGIEENAGVAPEVDRAGNIDGSSQNPLPIGRWACWAEGDVKVSPSHSQSLYVLTGETGEFTQVHAASFTPESLEDQEYEDTIVVVEPPASWTFDLKGYISYSNPDWREDTIPACDCHGIITKEDHETRSIGVSHEVSWHGIKVTNGITYESSVTYSVNWPREGENENRSTKVQVIWPLRRAVDYRTHYDGEEFDKPIIVNTIDIRRRRPSADVWMQCCH